MRTIVLSRAMGISVERATGEEFERWDSYVDRSDHASPFHRRRALELIARSHGHVLHPLIGYKGEQPIGLFPLFETRTGPFKTVASPPPNGEIAYLGPVRVAGTDRKQRKLEKERRRFIEGTIDWIDAEIDPDLVQIRCVDGFTDVRPFLWRQFDVTPSYTYVVDLRRGRDELLESFSSDARRNIQDSEEMDAVVEIGGRDVLEPFNELVRARLEEKGIRYDLSADFLADLYDALGSDRVRPYVCRLDGEIVGGTLALKEGDALYGWIGGAAPSVDGPVNEAVDWRIIRDGIEEGLERYDLHGAMERGVTEYKSKFAPDLKPLFEVTRKSSGARAASELIDQMPDSIRSIVR